MIKDILLIFVYILETIAYLYFYYLWIFILKTFMYDFLSYFLAFPVAHFIWFAYFYKFLPSIIFSPDKDD